MATPYGWRRKRGGMLLVCIGSSSARSQKGFERPGKDSDNKRDQDKPKV